jgi:hypothetical protein
MFKSFNITLKNINFKFDKKNFGGKTIVYDPPPLPLFKLAKIGH